MNLPSLLPLQGKTIIVTRSQDQQAEARLLFEKSGAKVLDLPALVIGPPDDWTPLDDALVDLKNFNWIIFSSVNGVKSVEKRLKLIGSSLFQKPPSLKIAAVGRKTSHSLESLGVIPDFVPPQFIADSLIKHFPEPASALRVLIPRVQTGGRTLLSEAFCKAGSKVIEVPAYESKCPHDFPSETAIALHDKEVDGIIFTSSKIAANTAHLISNCFGPGWKDIIKNVYLISIGPQTSISCKKYFHRVDQEASKHDLDGLVAASIKLIGNRI